MDQKALATVRLKVWPIFFIFFQLLETDNKQ